MGANDYQLGREEPEKNPVPEEANTLKESYRATDAAQDPGRTLLYDEDGGDEFYDDATGEDAWIEADDSWVYNLSSGEMR